MVEKAMDHALPDSLLDLGGKRVLVTGGAGFVGSHVVDEVLRRGAHATVVDNFSTGFREFVEKRDRVTLVEGDLLDTKLLGKTMPGHDWVFHIAANADIKDGLLHPRLDIEQNIIATQNVLEAMRAHRVNKIVFSSTAAVYGEPDVFPTPEDAPLPIQTSFYATSKIAAEGLLTSYAYGYGFSAWIFRYVSLLGPRYSHGHVVDFYRKLKKDPSGLDVLGDGKQQKSYLHVADCIRGIFRAIERSKSNNNIHIYNIGHDEGLEVTESIAIICRELGVSPKLRFSGGARGWVGDSPRIQLDSRRLRALGWAPEHSLEESLVETLRFLREHPYLIREATRSGR
jgi:UDP-glucose 4-epimerase